MFEEFFLIAGPCVLEDDSLHMRVAGAVAEIGREFGLPVVFKASFDKANRSGVASARGPGFERGLEQLARVHAETGLPVLTDIHVPEQAAAAADAVQALQIPAFLCRQTDLLVAAGRTGLPVAIKKGQWMEPEEMAGAVAKVRSGGSDEIALTERGTFMGYGDLVVDMRSFQRMRTATGVPTIFDGTHSVQRPGRGEGRSGGDPQYIPALVRAAVAAGCDGLFLETHPNPAAAPSDATNMLPLPALRDVVQQALEVRAALQAP